MKSVFQILFFAFAIFFAEFSNCQLHFQTQVNKSENDAEENISNGNVDLTSSDLELCYDPGFIGISSKDQYVGIRFESINIPKSAIIDSAFIQFTADGTTSGPTIVLIYGEKMFNSPPFTTLSENISSRTRTDEFVTWNIPEWDQNNAATNNERSPNLKFIVSEIISQSLWQTNNSISFIIEGSGTRRAYSWDGSEQQAPILNIYYRENNASTSDQKLAKINCYPNPTSDFVYLDLTDKPYGEISYLEILDMSGKLLKKMDLNGGEKHKVNLMEFQGMVLFRLHSNNQVAIQRVLIN